MRHNDEGFRRLLKLYAVNRMVVGAHLSVRPGALNHTLCFLSTIGRKNHDGARANTRVRPYRHIETNNYRIKSNCRGAPCGLPWSLNILLFSHNYLFFDVEAISHNFLLLCREHYPLTCKCTHMNRLFHTNLYLYANTLSKCLVSFVPTPFQYYSNTFIVIFQGEYVYIRGTGGRDNNVGSHKKTDCFSMRLILPYVLRDYMSRSAQPTADCPLAQPKKIFLKTDFSVSSLSYPVCYYYLVK